MALTQGLTLMQTGVYFLAWTYRLNKNLRARGVAGVRYAPAWAMAYQVFREVWQASASAPAARTDRAWQRSRSPALLGFWWAAVILTNVMGSVSARRARDVSIDVADNAVALLTTLLAFQVVRLVTARQDKTARLLSLIR